MIRNSFLPEIIKCTGCDPEDAPMIARIMREMHNKPLGLLTPPQFLKSAREISINKRLSELFGEHFSLN
jgi:hypothetical protein